MIWNADKGLWVPRRSILRFKDPRCRTVCSFEPFAFAGASDWFRAQLVSVTATVYNTTTSPKTTASIPVQAGDTMVAFFGLANATATSATISDTDTNAWTSLREYGPGGASVAYARCWAATAVNTTALTVSFTQPDALNKGGEVHLWRHSPGVGNSVLANNGTGSGAPTATLPANRGNSGISAFVVDWNSVTGTDTWTNLAGVPKNQTDFADGTSYGVHSVTYPDAGSAGDKTVSMSVPSTQRYGIIAVEILAAA